MEENKIASFPDVWTCFWKNKRNFLIWKYCYGYLDRYIAQDVTKRICVCSPFGTDIKDSADNISNTAALQDRLSQVLNDKRTRYGFQQQI